MNRFTVEETNLLTHLPRRRQGRSLSENINAALPFMDAGYAGACRPHPCQNRRADGSRSMRSLPFTPLTRYDRGKAACAAPKPQGQRPCTPGVLQLR